MVNFIYSSIIKFYSQILAQIQIFPHHTHTFIHLYASQRLKWNLYVGQRNSCLISVVLQMLSIILFIIIYLFIFYFFQFYFLYYFYLCICSMNSVGSCWKWEQSNSLETIADKNYDKYLVYIVVAIAIINNGYI